ncbi:thioredoxin [bacterium]|nr:thioredoxin [bacterium]
MLDTDLKSIESHEEIDELLKNNENIMICCGRMGPMCIPVYGIMEKLEVKYPDVKMRNMSFDITAASFIKRLPECSHFRGLPFTVYFKNGKVVKATTSIQNEKEVTDILDEVFKD